MGSRETFCASGRRRRRGWSGRGGVERSTRNALENDKNIAVSTVGCRCLRVRFSDREMWIAKHTGTVVVGW